MRFFRDIITIFAAVLAIALGVALALPYVIDWKEHRQTIVTLLERSTGSKIDVAGDIDLKLLPSPKLRLGKVRIKGLASQSARLEAERVYLELGLTPLLRGEFRFVDIAIERAQLHLVQQGDGSFTIPVPPQGRPEQIAFERVVVRESEIVIDRAAGTPPLRIGVPLLEAAGQSLSGPFRGSGNVQWEKTGIAFSFNTGIAESEGIRIKLVSEADGTIPRVELDGLLGLKRTSGERFAPAFDGTAVIAGKALMPGVAETPWRISGPVIANVLSIESKQFELRAGEEANSLAATGVLQAKLSSPAEVRLSLNAPQINVDGLLGGEQGPAQAMRNFAAGLQAAANRDFLPPAITAPVHVEILTPALTLGGETLSDVGLRLVLARGKTTAVDFSTGAPGSTRVVMRGQFESGMAPVFRGDVEFATRDMQRLQQWLAPGFAQVAALAKAVPYRSLRLKGKADISKAGVAGKDLEIVAGRTQFNGAMIFTRAIGTERARLHVDLNSPQLDIDGLADISAPAKALGDTDIFLAMDARAVRLARFGSGMIDAGRISIRLEREKGALSMTKFDIQNLGAANVSATAALAHGAGWLNVKLDAKNLVELSGLLQRVAPGPWTRALAARAPSLSPANVKIVMRGRTAPQADLPALTQLQIDGDLNGTKISASARPQRDAALSSGRLNARNAKTAVLLRQLGFEAVSLSSPGESVVDVRWTNPASGKTQAKVTANLAGAQFDFNGDVGKGLPDADFRGKVTVRSSDAGPLLQTLAIALPDVSQRAPVDLGGDFAWQGNRVSAGNIAGSVLGAKIAGRLVFAPRVLDANLTQHVFSGDLQFDQLSLRGIASLLLGPAQEGDGPWRDAKFARPAADVFADKLSLTAGRFDLPGGVRAEAARLSLSMSPGLLVLDDLSMRTGKARINGKMTLRRDKGAAALSGKLNVDMPGAAITAMTGRVATTLDFAATGDSERTLISGLAGSGSLKVTDFAIEGLDTRALQRVMASAESEKLDVNEAGVLRALTRQLASGPLRFSSKDFTISIAGGVARLQSKTEQGLPGDVDAALSAAFDLRSLAGETKIELTARERPKDWTGALPALTIVRNTDRPEQKILAANLVNGLSAMAILREAARVEALEFDIRERAYFNRREKAVQYLRERQTEIRAWHAEQARLAEDAYIKADENARRAEEEARKAVAKKKHAVEETAGKIKAPAVSAPMQLVPKNLQPGAR